MGCDEDENNHERFKSLRYCFVPSCKNNSWKHASKHFFAVPVSCKNKWCEAVGYLRSSSTRLYVCEDHLNLKEDVQNYQYWITTKGRARLKPILPQSLLTVASTSSLHHDNNETGPIVSSSNAPASDSDEDLSEDEDNFVLSSHGGKGQPGPSSVPSALTTARNEAFTCKICNAEISTGFRYVCVECPDFDICDPCVAVAEHAHHYVLRIPMNKPLAEATSVLNRIRRALAAAESADDDGDELEPEPEPMQEPEILKLEVKEEPDPLDVTVNKPAMLPPSVMEQPLLSIKLEPDDCMDVGDTVVSAPAQGHAESSREPTKRPAETTIEVPAKKIYMVQLAQTANQGSVPQQVSLTEVPVVFQGTSSHTPTNLPQGLINIPQSLVNLRQDLISGTQYVINPQMLIPQGGVTQSVMGSQSVVSQSSVVPQSVMVSQSAVSTQSTVVPQSTMVLQRVLSQDLMKVAGTSEMSFLVSPSTSAPQGSGTAQGNKEAQGIQTATSSDAKISVFTHADRPQEEKSKKKGKAAKKKS